MEIGQAADLERLEHLIAFHPWRQELEVILMVHMTPQTLEQ
jgi:hypothetical protein